VTRVDAAALGDWAACCLRAVGMSADDAAEVAGSLVQTSLWGIDSHGVARLPHYLDRLSRGSINARPRVTVDRTGPCTAQLAGDRGHGIAIAHHAMRLAIGIAREHGIAAAGVADSSHCGAIGLYTRQAAREGLVAFAFTHADSVAAPHGGQRPFFGTNPLSIAFPRAGGEPVCLDMATTSIPFNRVMNARREGRPLPPDVAIDRDGRPTTDAERAVAVTPLGGADYGHKGYALALMIDLLCGPLLGNPFGPHIPPMFGDLDAPRRLGALFIVVDPMRFGGGAALAATVEAMARELAAEPGAPRMPGDPEQQQAQRRRDGIPVDAALAQQFRDWGDRLGVPAPL
jgi:ureidoglycolate dehydrogenase (NAD+)